MRKIFYALFTSRILLTGVGLMIGLMVAAEFLPQSINNVRLAETTVQETTTEKVPEADDSYVVETDKDNNKVASGNYSNGCRVGHWDIFYPDGSIKASGEYKNGKPFGIWRFYYQNGELKSEGRYGPDGNNLGLWLTYHEDGSRKTEGRYKAGLPVGYWVTCPNANSQSNYWYGMYNTNGLQSGNWYWYENGEVKVVETYANGKLVDTNYRN